MKALLIKLWAWWERLTYETEEKAADRQQWGGP